MVPIADLLAVSLAIVLGGALSPLAALYAMVVVFTLACTADAHLRVSPALAGSLPRVLCLLFAPFVVVGPMAATSDDAIRLLEVLPLLAFSTVAFRLLGYRIIRGARMHGLVADRTVIVGAGPLGISLAEATKQHPELGIEVVGFLDTLAEGPVDIPVLGPPAGLKEVLLSASVRRVIVADTSIDDAVLVQLLRDCDRLPVEIHVVPKLFQLGVVVPSAIVDVIRGIPMVRVRRVALRTLSWRLKRMFDTTIACIGVLVAAPVMILAALAVRLSSPGPVLFRQTRVGQDGRLFEILKFRSMRENSDSDVTWSVERDPRVTPVGRFLRRTGLDELPQLFNVIKGDMSLVGPRPERPHFADTFNGLLPDYWHRHRVPVGITGWAQVHELRGDSSIEERTRFDNYYIDHWSIWSDIVIMARTIRTVFRPRAVDDDARPAVGSGTE